MSEALELHKKDQEKIKVGSLIEGPAEEIDCMLEKQEHICAICKRSDSRHLSLDHCHVTGKVRKFLCDKCNLGLGKFEDNIESLLNAVKYLKEFKD